MHKQTVQAEKRMQVFAYRLVYRKPNGRKIRHLQRILQIYVINSKYSIFMKHFQSSTSVVVEVPAQQLFVHLTVFLHKTKVNALKHTEALNTFFLKSTNTTAFLQYSCGRECRRALLGVCADRNALARDSQLECVGKRVICQ